MISVAIDPARFAASGLSYAPATATTVSFTFPPVAGEKPLSVSVAVSGGNLQFFPERSSLHREVLKALGL